MAPLEINVHGTGTSVHFAERAILSLQAQTKQLATQAAASSALTETANALRDIITEYCPQDEETGRTLPDAPISHYSMSTMDTQSHIQHDKDRRQLAPLYSARANYIVKFQDFQALNSLATRFSAMENVKISKIDWSLTDKTFNSLKGGTRKHAAQDAIQKAWDYAEVFAGIVPEDLKTRVRPVSLTEQAHYSQSTRPQLHFGKLQRGVTTSTEELQFEPEDVKLDVTINAKFIVEV